MAFPLTLQILGETLAAQLPTGSTLRLDGRGSVRVDAAVATAFVAQELEHLRSRTYDVTRVALRARDFLPVNNEAHPGAEIISYDQYDGMGEADIVQNYAKDFPRVDAEKNRFQNAVFSLGDSYGYSIQDLRAIAMSGSRLNEQRALQARRGIEVKFEKIVARGDARFGKTGFLTSSAVPLFPTALAWDMTTPAGTIKRELGALVQSIVVQSQQIWQPDTLILPTQAFAIASEKSFGTDNAKSVLRVFLEENPYIKRIDQWVQCDGAGAGGADRIVAYKMSSEVAEIENPVEYEEFPPQVDGAEFKILGHMRTAGATIRYPLGMAYADGTFDAADITE